MSPSTGVEYWAEVSPELARSWSAASQRRFSSASVAASFAEGATQYIGPESYHSSSVKSCKEKKEAGGARIKKDTGGREEWLKGGSCPRIAQRSWAIRRRGPADPAVRPGLHLGAHAVPPA